MKGLLIKEFLSIRRYFKTLSALLIAYVIICISSRSTATLAALGGFLAMICTLSSFSYDNYNHFDEFALSLPLTRQDLVKSKYLFMLLVSLLSLIFIAFISFLLGIFMGLPLAEILGSCISSLLVSLILGALMIPIIYKFGVEQARYVVMIIIMVITLVGVFLGGLAETFGIAPMSEAALMVLLYISPLFALALTALSYVISIQIFTRKEL